jgi:hypothetical protein
MSDKLTAAFHVTLPYARKYGPWISLAVSSQIVANDLLKKSK